MIMLHPTTSHSTSAVASAAAPAEIGLRLPKAMAGRYLRNLIDKGVAIRRQRIRYIEDLEELRAKKADWVQSYTSVLGQLFTEDSIAEACNDWVGRVYPEYAETSLFVEQFYEEMDHRIRRLRAVLKKLAELSDPVIPVSSLPVVLDERGAEAIHGEAAAGSAEAHGPPAPDVVTQRGLATPPAPEPLAPPVCGIVVAHGEQLAAIAPIIAFMRELGVELLSLDDPPIAGRKMLDAYEQGPEASFALLALAPAEAAAMRQSADDVGMHCPGAVAFQLGYFVGRLGASRVCVLCPGMSDTFQDAHGVTYLPLDSALGWQLHLARHLRRAGIDIDLNRLC